MSRSKRTYLLPGGKPTQSAGRYIREWSELGRTCEMMMPGYQVTGYDPGIHLNRGNHSVVIEVEVAKFWEGVIRGRHSWGVQTPSKKKLTKKPTKKSARKSAKKGGWTDDGPSHADDAVDAELASLENTEDDWDG